MKVGQVAGRPHLGVGDSTCPVVHRDAHPGATHLLREPRLPAVVPGSELLVMLLSQAPRHLGGLGQIKEQAFLLVGTTAEKKKMISWIANWHK